MWRKTKKENKNTHKFSIPQNKKTFFHHNSDNSTYYNNSLLKTNCDKTENYQNKKPFAIKSYHNFILSEQYVMNNYNNSLFKKNCEKTKIYQNKKPLATKSYNNFIVSEQYIMDNAKEYGEVKEDEDNNSTHIYLYRHNIALTQNEINIQNETLYPIDLTQKKMFRCPLESCEHKPLNNHLIKYHLNYHCRNYHNNDNKQYLFYFQNKFGWKQVEYPPQDE